MFGAWRADDQAEAAPRIHIERCPAQPPGFHCFCESLLVHSAGRAKY